MPKIHFLKPRPAIEAEVGSKLMMTLLESGVPVASSCGGDGVCGKCRVKIMAGEKNLSPENPTETYLRERFSLERNERISCQADVLGDVTVDTTYW
jgi:2Fe-2S ferredoxin